VTTQLQLINIIIIILYYYLLDYCRGTIQNCCNSSYAAVWGGQDISTYDEHETRVQNFSWKTWRLKHKWCGNIKQDLKQYVKWLELVRDRFSAAIVKGCNFSATVTISRRVLRWVRIIDWFFITSLEICPSSHCILTISLVVEISSNNQYRFLRYVGYENKCQQLWGWRRSDLSINYLLLQLFSSKQPKAHNAVTYYQVVVTTSSSKHAIPRKLEKITRTRTPARSARDHWNLVRSLCCRSVLGLSVVQKIFDEVVYRMCLFLQENYRQNVFEVKEHICINTIQGSFTFRGPCIVTYSYNKTNEMH